jgi:hypothetical protein
VISDLVAPPPAWAAIAACNAAICWGDRAAIATKLGREACRRVPQPKLCPTGTCGALDGLDADGTRTRFGTLKIIELTQNLAPSIRTDIGNQQQSSARCRHLRSSTHRCTHPFTHTQIVRRAVRKQLQTETKNA